MSTIQLQPGVLNRGPNPALPPSGLAFGEFRSLAPRLSGEGPPPSGAGRAGLAWAAPVAQHGLGWIWTQPCWAPWGLPSPLWPQGLPLDPEGWMVSGSHKPSFLPTLPHGPIWVTSPPLSRGALPLPRGPTSHSWSLGPGSHPSVLVWVPALSLRHSRLRLLRGRAVGGRKKARTHGKDRLPLQSAPTSFVKCHSLITTPCARGQQGTSFHFTKEVREAQRGLRLSGHHTASERQHRACALARLPPSAPALRGGWPEGPGQLLRGLPLS